MIAGPTVPELSGARALTWGALALAVLAGGMSPAGTGGFAPVQLGTQCRLGIPGTAPACPCEQLDARTRLGLGLPLALDALDAAGLEALDGIGPARAAAIGAERLRAGPFGSTGALAERVPGIGPATAARVAEQLAGWPGAACESTAPGDLR